MKILVIGAGAIGSLMIHYLCRAGNDVTVLARRTADALRDNGLVVRHYLQHKTTTDHPTVVDSVPTDERFDIVFSVMQGQQQKAVLPTLFAVKTRLIVVVGNNPEADFCQNQILANRTDNCPLLFGFQLSAGHREGGKAVVGRLPKTELFIGGLHGAASPDAVSMVSRAFPAKGWKVTPLDDMHGFYLCHAAEILPYAYMCYKVGCQLKRLKRRDIKLIVRASDECFKYLKNLGVSIMPKNEDDFYRGGPKTCAMFLLYRLMSKTVLGRLMVSDHCKSGIEEMIYIDRKFDEFRALHPGRPMPVWDEIRRFMPKSEADFQKLIAKAQTN